MVETNIYNDIAQRTQGDIYIGVVGPVRSGKSTFIKKFMDTLVIPNIEQEYKRDRANDELPQASAGRTIMTTEPKFVPEDAVEITLPGNAKMNVRMIDCVGYILPSSIGYIENETPRMVMTPWYEEEIPFPLAAEIGTQKVINEHSTIGLVITTDGSITDIPRDEYEEAEERVIKELKSINKPFVVLMNTTNPSHDTIKRMCAVLSEKYSTPVIPVNCMSLDENEIRNIIGKILFEFPIKEVKIDMPKWINSLPTSHPFREKMFEAVKEAAGNLSNIRDSAMLVDAMQEIDDVENVRNEKTDLGKGSVTISVAIRPDLFYSILSQETGVQIDGEKGLMGCIMELAKTKKAYDRVKDAIDQVEATGYGIVMPSIDELKLENPELMKQGGRFGVRLRASAPSIHLMKADITTEVSPIVGSEKQSEDLVKYMMSEFDEDPIKIWDSNIFGKSLHELVNEGLHTKLSRMPDEARARIQQTLERLINEGCSGLICIIL